ncbi:MAG: hypothetical protein FWF96_00165 [Kiritimatiellaeota bacterium]|nr:hypothetical protein [Kiritimatiellota bacterium]
MNPEKSEKPADSSPYADIGDMPPALVSGLRMMITRVRRIQWLRGVVGTLAVLFFATLVIMAVEVTASPESPSVRWGLWSGILALTLGTAWVLLVKPLSKPLSITRMARVLETRHPDLQERISTVIELKGHGGESNALLDVLIREALLDMDAVSPRQEFTLRSAKPFLGAFAAAAGIFVLVAAVWPRETWISLVRTTAPHVKIANIAGLGIEVFPGDATVLRGTAFNLAVRVSDSALSKAREPVVRVYHGRRRVDESMRAVAPGTTGLLYRATHTLNFPAVHEPFTYEVRFGLNGLSRRYTVNVIPPPAVEEMSIYYEFPEYTGLAATQYVSNALMEIAALNGTRMTMIAKFNTPVKGHLLLGEWRLPPFRLDNELLQWKDITLTTNAAPSYAFEMRDTRFGHTNEIVHTRVRILMDQAPDIQQTNPGAYRFVVNPGTRVPFAYTLTDDFGVVSARLLVRDATRIILSEFPFELRQVNPNKWVVTANFSCQGLEIGKTYSIVCEATDNCPPEYGGPNIATSHPVTLLVQAAVTPAQSITGQVIDQQAKMLRDDIEFAASCLSAAADQVRAAHPHLAKEELPVEAKRNVETAAANANDANAVLIKAREFAKGTVFLKFPNDIDTVRANVVRPTAFNTGRILLFDPESRSDMAAENITELTHAAAEVRKLLDILQAYVDRAKELAALLALLQEQYQLAMQARREQMTQEEQQAWMQQMMASMEQAKEMTLEEKIEALRKALAAMELNLPMEQQAREDARQFAMAAQLIIDAAVDTLEAAQIDEVIARDSIQTDKVRDAATPAREAVASLRDALKAVLAPPAENDDPDEKAKAVATAAAAVRHAAETAASIAGDASRAVKNPRFADAAQKTETAAVTAAEAAAEPDAQAALTLAEQALALADPAAKAVENEHKRMARELEYAIGKAQRSSRRADEFIRANPFAFVMMTDIRTVNTLLQKAIKGATEATSLLKAATTEPQYEEVIKIALQAQADAQAALEAAKMAAEEAQQMMDASQDQQDAADEIDNFMMDLQDQMDAMADEAGLQMDTPPPEGMENNEGEGDDDDENGRNPRQPRKDADIKVEANWTQMRGRLNTDALDQDIQNISPEYRELVRQYFLELSK